MATIVHAQGARLHFGNFAIAVPVHFFGKESQRVRSRLSIEGVKEQGF